MSASFHWIAWNSPIALAERVALLRVLARDVVRGLRDADRLRGDPDPPAVERRHRDAEALALLVQEAVAADERALDDDVVRRRRVEAELLLVARDAHVLGVEDERARRRARPACSGRCARRAGTCPRSAPFVIHCFAPVIRQPSPLGVGRASAATPASEPASGSVSANAPISSPRASGGTKRARCSSVPKREQRQRRRARVHRDRHADAGVGARELLEHEDVREEVGARAAVLLRHAHAHQAELGELGEHLAREAVLAIPLGRVRLDLARAKSRVSAWISFCSARQLEVHAHECRLLARAAARDARAAASSRLAGTPRRPPGRTACPDWATISSCGRRPTAARAGTGGRSSSRRARRRRRRRAPPSGISCSPRPSG